MNHSTYLVHVKTYGLGAGVVVQFLRDITAEKFAQLHGEAFQDTHFLDSHIAVSGFEPEVRSGTSWLCRVRRCSRSDQGPVTY